MIRTSTWIGLFSFMGANAAFGTIGVVAYARARRKGLAKSRCKLGDTRLVIAYLAIAGSVGIAVTAINLIDLVT